jgi:NitT/TauT family transport system substrate-binding protein
VDRRQADLGAIAPERFALRLQQGLPLVSVWQIDEADPFALAFRKGEAPAALKALSGKTVLLDAAARRPFCDVWFAQAGLEPGAVAYREAGPGWGEALARGRGDAALAWEGQRALWRGQNLGFDYLPGRAVSRLPGACFVARAADLAADLADDLADAGRRAPLQAALRGWAMGVTFAARNPRAAAHLLSQSAPGLAERMPPPVATDAVMRCVAAARADGAVAGGLGRHDADRWALLFATMRKIGQIAAPLAASAAVSNDLIAGANAFDADAVRSDADRYALPPEFAAVDVDALRAAP